MPDSPLPERFPTLFIHGGGVSRWMWRPVVTRLGSGLDPVTVDLPGHGERYDETYPGHAATTARLADEIRRSHPAGVHVVGFSLGAQLAILLASHHPELIRSAVIVSAETIPAPMPRLTILMLKLALPLARVAWFARAQASALAIPRELIEDYVHESTRISTASLLHSVEENIRFTLPPEWGAYKGPVTVVIGATERGLMQRSARATHAALPGSTLLSVEGSAHDVPFTNTAALADVIRALRAPWGER